MNTEEPELTKKLFAYCRLSKQEKDKQSVSQSIKTQRRAIERYVAASLNLEIEAWYVDDGVSGTKKLENRPAGEKMMLAMREGKIDGLIVMKLDRLFRNLEDAILREREWSRQNIALHVLDLGGQAVDTSTAAGALHYNMMSAMAQFEVERIGERITENKAARKAARKVYAVPRYGEKHVSGKIVPHERERRVIQFMFRMRDLGNGYSAIAQELNRRVIRTKKGKKWYPQTVKRILMNYTRGELNLPEVVTVANDPLPKVPSQVIPVEKEAETKTSSDSGND